MARPNKTGLKYYSIDTNRYSDIKIRRLRNDLGCAGLATYDYLLNKIYENGCWLQWDENAMWDVAEYLRLELGEVDKVVRYCANIGLFDEGLFEGEKILTSSAIQKRYFKICIQAKIKYEVPEKFLLIDINPTENRKTDVRKSTEESKKSTEENNKYTEENKEATEESTQSKVKEIKVKEIERENKKEKCAREEILQSNIFRKPVIPTFEQVFEVFCRNELDFDKAKLMAKKFYDTYNAVGWFCKGSPIVDFTALASNYAETWRQNERVKKKSNSTKDATVNTYNPALNNSF